MIPRMRTGIVDDGAISVPAARTTGSTARDQTCGINSITACVRSCISRL